jgi:hypothetical protein
LNERNKRAVSLEALSRDISVKIRDIFISMTLSGADSLQNSDSKVHPTAIPPEIDCAKNKVEFGGAFFVSRRSHVNAPRLPRITPQIDHQNTTICTSFSQKILAKALIHQLQKKSAAAAFFVRSNERKAGSNPGLLVC